MIAKLIWENAEEIAKKGSTFLSIGSKRGNVRNLADRYPFKAALVSVPESFVSSLYGRRAGIQKGRGACFISFQTVPRIQIGSYGALTSQWSRIRKRLADSCVNTQRFSKQNMGRSSKINGSTCSLKYKNKQKQIGLIVEVCKNSLRGLL